MATFVFIYVRKRNHKSNIWIDCPRASPAEKERELWMCWLWQPVNFLGNTFPALNHINIWCSASQVNILAPVSHLISWHQTCLSKHLSPQILGYPFFPLFNTNMTKILFWYFLFRCYAVGISRNDPIHSLSIHHQLSLCVKCKMNFVKSLWQAEL